MDRMGTDGYERVRGSLLDMRDGAWKKKKTTATCTVGRHGRTRQRQGEVGGRL